MRCALSRYCRRPTNIIQQTVELEEYKGQDGVLGRGQVSDEGVEIAVQFPLSWLPRWIICSGMVSCTFNLVVVFITLTQNRKTQQDNQLLSGLNSLKYSVWISRGAGLVLSVDAAMILLPMCRNILRIIRPKLKFLPLDESQWFHRQVAYSMLLYTIAHVCAHYVK